MTLITLFKIMAFWFAVAVVCQLLITKFVKFYPTGKRSQKDLDREEMDLHIKHIVRMNAKR